MDTVEIPAGAVVVGVDGSPTAHRALLWAAGQAARERRPLVLVHAVGPVDPYWMVQPVVDVQALRDAMGDAAQQVIDDARSAVAAAHPELEVAAGWSQADARHLLVEASGRAGLVVVGSHGHGVVRRFLLGSVSVGLTRHAHCPVAVVRADGPAGAGVLVGIDGSEQSRPTLDEAFRLATTRGEPLTVVHCLFDHEHDDQTPAVIDPEDERYADLRRSVSQLLAGYGGRFPDVVATTVLVRGLVDDILLDLADGADVAVVGSRERSTLGDLLLGSVAGTLVEHATCTVVVVPRP